MPIEKSHSNSSTNNNVIAEARCPNDSSNNDIGGKVPSNSRLSRSGANINSNSGANSNSNSSENEANKESPAENKNKGSATAHGDDNKALTNAITDALKRINERFG